MPSLWRPLATPWLLLLVVVGIAAYDGATLPPGALVAMGAAATLFMLVPVGISRRLVTKVLDGMAQAGLELVIVQDVHGWLGARVVHARGPAGTWRILGEVHQAGIGVEVTPPGHERARQLTGDKRRAAYELATEALTGQLSPEQVPGQTGLTPETRRRFPEEGTVASTGQPPWVILHPLLSGGAVLLAGVGMVSLALWLGSTDPLGLPDVAVSLATWLGLATLGVGGAVLGLAALFGARAGHAAVAWESWEVPGLVVVTTAAMGGGLVAFGAGRWVQAAWAAGALAASPLVLVGAGLLAVVLAIGALAPAARVGRPVAALAALAVGLGGVHLLVRVHGYLGAPVLLTAVVLLYLLWRPV